VQVCDQIGVPLEVVPLTDAYWKRVVDHCVKEIQAGRTPNPDVLCNSRVKFGAFEEHLAAKFGESFDRVASGHYARVERLPPLHIRGAQLTPSRERGSASTEYAVPAASELPATDQYSTAEEPPRPELEPVDMEVLVESVHVATGALHAASASGGKTREAGQSKAMRSEVVVDDAQHTCGYSQGNWQERARTASALQHSRGSIAGRASQEYSESGEQPGMQMVQMQWQSCADSAANTATPSSSYTSRPVDTAAAPAHRRADVGRVHLRMTCDEIKDQTYFLAHLSQAQLSRAMFPLGHMNKAQVRKLAAEVGLASNNRKDSQGLCFLGKVKFSEFIKV
jgi:hypothetical protein